MALTDGEVARIRYELGHNLLAVGAEPYIGVTSLFRQVIQPFIETGASTTSSTEISAVAVGSPATLAAVTLASSTGFAAGDRIAVDVEDAQEVTTVRSIAGAVISVFLSKAHPGTYPVTVEGGEAIVRDILRQLRRFSEPRGYLEKAASGAGIKKVDEVEFFDRATMSRSRELRREQAYWRDELASALGCENLRGTGGGSCVAMY